MYGIVINDTYKLTDKLCYKNLTFYFVGTSTENDRVYLCSDELNPKTIITAPCDYDGALIGKVDECFRESEDDDMIRYFDSITGFE